MPSEHPPKREVAHNSDEDNEEEEEEEEEEEQIEEWAVLTPFSELDELEDGPSTIFVGGFSVCEHLGDAIDRVQFKEDIILVFPRLYSEARSTAAAGSSLELNEAKLGGLRIYSIAYAGDLASSHSKKHASTPRYAAPAKRRVGPWFTNLTAVATAAFLVQDGSSNGNGQTEEAAPPKLGKKHHPIKTAASRAAAMADANGASATADAATTSSGSSVFAPSLTATVANPEFFPVFDFPISIVYESDGTEDPASVQGLPHYVQQSGGEDEAGDAEEGSEAGDGAGDKGAGDASEEGGADRHGNGGVSRSGRIITLAGISARAGISLGSLTRTHVTHCVVGCPGQQRCSAATTLTAPPRIALTAAPLTEALADFCVIYGGTAYGLYAYPRSAITLRSCIVEGPNADAVKYNAENTTTGASAAEQGSVIAHLHQRNARAQRLRRYMQRFEDADGSGGGGDEEGAAALDMEDGVLPRFGVPNAGAAAASEMSCEVAIMCDDADVQLTDCLITHARHGLILHDSCAGTVVKGVSIRSMAEVGIYLYGMSGAATIQYSAVQACGQTCLLVVGPTVSQVMEAEAALPRRPAEDEEEEGAGELDDDDNAKPRPIFAQHPHIRGNCFIGVVRVQGEVRSGAMMDNCIFLPREEQGAAAAVASQTLLSMKEDAARGFLYVGLEGERAPPRTPAADGAD